MATQTQLGVPPPGIPKSVPFWTLQPKDGLHGGQPMMTTLAHMSQKFDNQAATMNGLAPAPVPNQNQAMQNVVNPNAPAGYLNPVNPNAPPSYEESKKENDKESSKVDSTLVKKSTGDNFGINPSAPQHPSPQQQQQQHGHQQMIGQQQMVVGSSQGHNMPAMMDTDITQPGRLLITVTKGRSLKNKEIIGRQDPYVRIRCGRCRVQSQYHKNGGNRATWDATFSFVLDGSIKDFELTVLDKEIFRDDKVGSAIVEIPRLLSPPGVEQYVPIFGTTFFNSTPQKHGEVGIIAKYSIFKPGKLTIFLKDATLAENRDYGKQDPYVKFFLDNDKKTMVRSSTHNSAGKTPVWEQVLEVLVTGPEQFLDIEVFDEDTFSRDDKLGTTRLRVADLKLAVPGVHAFPLQHKGVPSGVLNFSVMWTTHV